MNIRQNIAELFGEPEQTAHINSRIKKLGTYLLKFFVSLCLTTVMMYVYVEVGNSRDWPRAARWHECLHQHGHFGFKKF